MLTTLFSPPADPPTQYPFTGTGKPEQLKYELAGYLSRHINQEHRLVYKVNEDIVKVVTAKGHYS